MTNVLKQFATWLPLRTQQTLKRRYFAWKIRTGRFASEEPEFRLLGQYLQPGDWALDIGANVGYYAARMSELVGASGRVLAFEPIAESFELLSANSRLFPFANTTLFNVAVSDQPRMVEMAVPTWTSGGNNYYEAFITQQHDGVPVFAVSIDSLDIPHRVALAKIDTEGHELAVLRGMIRLITRDRPVLIVEANSTDTAAFLKGLGYSLERETSSNNYTAYFSATSSTRLVAKDCECIYCG